MRPLQQQITALTHAHGIHMNTNLGQHFLADPTVLSTMIRTAKLGADDTVVEIGSGIGILTKELCSIVQKVITIEMDQRWIPLLREYVGSKAEALGTLQIVHADALDVPLPTDPYKIVANLPYQITSPLLRKALQDSPVRPTSLTLLIQREVAEKICDTVHHGLLTILVGLFGTPHIVRHVPPGAFLPPPAVDSAILHITCFPEPLANKTTIEEVFRLTSLAFGQKRKMLRGTVGKIRSGMERLAMASIEPTRRPETLTVQEWIALAKTAQKA